MSNNTNYCGSSKTMGQGDVAVCGRVWWVSVYQCDKCKLKDAEDLIVKQVEQVKMLRDKLTMANEWLSVECGYIGSPISAEISEALESTKEKV